MTAKTTDLTKMIQHEALCQKVLAIMAATGWQSGKGSLARKNYKTIQVGQEAIAFLSTDDGYNNALTFKFQSEGRNVCEAATALIPVGANDELLQRTVAASVATAEKQIQESFAVRALRII